MQASVPVDGQTRWGQSPKWKGASEGCQAVRAGPRTTALPLPRAGGFCPAVSMNSKRGWLWCKREGQRPPAWGRGQLAGQPRGPLPRFFQVWEDEAASLSMLLVMDNKGGPMHILGARNTSQAKRGARPRKVPMKT